MSTISFLLISINKDLMDVIFTEKNGRSHSYIPIFFFESLYEIPILNYKLWDCILAIYVIIFS